MKIIVACLFTYILYKYAVRFDDALCRHQEEFQVVVVVVVVVVAVENTSGHQN
jgi:hypothetical protein